MSGQEIGKRLARVEGALSFSHKFSFFFQQLSLFFSEQKKGQVLYGGERRRREERKWLWLMAGGGGGGSSTAATATTKTSTTRISSSVLGFNWCMKKPVALGSSTPPGARKAYRKVGGKVTADNDTAGVDGTVTAANIKMAKHGSPNPARDLAESLSAFDELPFSPRKDIENTGE